MNKDMIYRFKFYFIDGTIKYSDCKCNRRKRINFK